MSKKLYVPMRMHNGATDICKLNLPPRCKGMLFVFETKKAARDFMGKNNEIMTVEKVKE